MVNERYKRVVVVGRFQPPHLGHVKLIEHALRVGEKVIIVVGSAQESFSLKNPLTAGERIELLERIISARFHDDRDRILIIPVMDINMNKVWVQYLRMLLPRFDAVVTRNPLVAELFKDMGYPVIRQELYHREECSGTRIRELVVGGGDWTRCVPSEILELLEEFDFEGRLRRLSQND